MSIQDILAYPLSNDDIQEFLNPDTKILTYPQFASMSHIDEAFDALGRCIFLFLTTSPTSGHWLCMFKRGDTIEYFDSYGERPEAQREWLSEEELEELGQDEPYLWNLMRASGYKIFSNTVQYQKERGDISTCGRWCLLRLVCKDFTNKQFYQFIKAQMKERNLKNMDEVVAILTFEEIGK
jgi:hypothetical protein